jgi:hypothetical protein
MIFALFRLLAGANFQFCLSKLHVKKEPVCGPLIQRRHPYGSLKHLGALINLPCDQNLEVNKEAKESYIVLTIQTRLYSPVINKLYNFGGEIIDWYGEKRR